MARLFLLSPVLLALVTACHAPTHLRVDDLRAAEAVEVALDGHGWPLEIEYYIDPDQVPARIHEAMESLHPGGQVSGAEKEYLGGAVYWELTKTIAGMDVEAMFADDGSLHSEEVQVPRAPDAIHAVVREHRPGQVIKWEEIRDGQQQLVQYHAKVVAEGRRYKVMVDADGRLAGVVRELDAEVEIPVE